MPESIPDPTDRAAFLAIIATEVPAELESAKAALIAEFEI